MADRRAQACGAGQSRSGDSVCRVEGSEATRGEHPSAGGRPSRAPLQPGPWHPAPYSRGEREEPRRIRARVQYIGHGSEVVMSDTAVLLIAHGSPERVEDIPAFLQNISRGRPVSDAVLREVQHRYSLIGSSPLTKITRVQADNVARELDLPVYVGMRNWHPYIADTLKQMASDNVGQAVAVCMAPHNSRTSVGAYKQTLFGGSVAFPV